MKSILALAPLIAVCGAASVAHASPVNLVQNGGFEQTTAPGPNFFTSNDIGTDAVDWTYDGIASTVYAAGTADTTGSYQGGNGYQYLWGPGTGSNNGLTAASPAGGNFLALDTGQGGAAILDQLITGLVAGKTYELSFDWAAAQYETDGGAFYNGATYDSFAVTLLDQSTFTIFRTSVVNIPSHGFSGWMTQNFFYTADSSTELLAFDGFGPNLGLPPVALLDGVSLSEVPEPAAWTMMFVGIGALGAVARRRRTTAALAA